MACAWLHPRVQQDHLRGGTDLSLVQEGQRVGFRLATSEKHAHQARGSDVAICDVEEEPPIDLEEQEEEEEEAETAAYPSGFKAEPVERCEDQNVSRESVFFEASFM